MLVAVPLDATLPVVGFEVLRILGDGLVEEPNRLVHVPGVLGCDTKGGIDVAKADILFGEGGEDLHGPAEFPNYYLQDEVL